MNTKQLLKKNGIRAQVLTKWGGGSKPGDTRCKFWPFELARLKRTQKRGRVLAVSTPDGENIRAANRGHTTYYVMFDDVVKGYLSHKLDTVV